MSQARPRVSVYRLLAFQLSLLPALFAALFVPALAHAAPGDLDPSFSKNGKVMTDFGGNNFATSVAIDAQGRIVAVGSTVKGW
jgi:hypothetical protein